MVCQQWFNSGDSNGNGDASTTWFVVSIYGCFHTWGYPKLMVYNGKSFWHGFFRGTHSLGNLHICVYIYTYIYIYIFYIHIIYIYTHLFLYIFIYTYFIYTYFIYIHIVFTYYIHIYLYTYFLYIYIYMYIYLMLAPRIMIPTDSSSISMVFPIFSKQWSLYRRVRNLGPKTWTWRWKERVRLLPFDSQTEFNSFLRKKSFL